MLTGLGLVVVKGGPNSVMCGFGHRAGEGRSGSSEVSDESCSVSLEKILRPD